MELEVTEEAPVSQVRKERNLGPYMEILRRSWENDVALGVKVADADAKSTQARFRQAAQELGMGCAMAVRELDGADGYGYVKVVVQAKEKRAYTGRKAGSTRKGKKS